MNKDLSNIFNEMNKDDLMDFFKECGLEVESVEPGKGGFYLDGKSVEINQYSSFEISTKINTIEKYATNKDNLCGHNWNAINYIKNQLSNRNCNCVGYISKLIQDQECIVNSKIEEQVYNNIDNNYNECDDFSKAA